MIHSYGHPEALGHAAVNALFLGPVVVQEKVDGSQWSVSKVEGEVLFRSRKQPVHVGNAGMFTAGVEAFLERAELLHEGWTYRGEYLSKPKHNVLAYGRVPRGHAILFDVETDRGQHYLNPAELAAEAERIDLESVPCFHEGPVGSVDGLNDLLDTESVLGGVKVEGIVVKNYERFSRDSHILMGKLVRGDFKEAHKVDWKKGNPGASDIVDRLTLSFRTEARWNKAIQHLSEMGILEGQPRDIGPLMVEIQADVEGEEAEAIKQALYDWAWPKIRRGLGAGFPAFYLERLAASQPV